MTRAVELPLWLFVLILAFAGVTFASHFLFPSVRWFFRRRAERLVAELNRRLDRPIQPFKLLRRPDMIQRLIYDTEVIRAVQEHAHANAVREDVAFETARRYAREIVPSFSATAYFGIAIRLARWLSESLYHVRIGHLDEAALEAIPQDATVVYVMNHRSNMDYVLVTWLASERTTLSYAVGEWARVWPLSGLIRAMGAYFIRRRTPNPLYRRVLARYVQLAAGAGVTQAVFPEGGLSLDGRLAPPRLGILSYILAAQQPGAREIVFVPVALNYDRVIEDRILTEAAASGERRFRARAPDAIAFVLRYVRRRLLGRTGRFGDAAVVFGRPVALSDALKCADGDPTAEVAALIMARIAEAMPVLPVPLVAHLLTGPSAPRTRDALVAAVAAEPLLSAETAVWTGDADALVDQALRNLAGRNLVSVSGAEVSVRPDALPLLRFYAEAMPVRESAET